MKPTGHAGGLKGHVFDVNNAESLPTFFRNYSEERREREAEALNEKYRIVEECECGEPLIAEEHLAHLMDHAPSRIRHWVRTIMSIAPEDRGEVIRIVTELSEKGF